MFFVPLPVLLLLLASLLVMVMVVGIVVVVLFRCCSHVQVISENLVCGRRTGSQNS